jgi:hypothetical protein
MCKQKLLVTKKFEVTTTPSGKIFADVNDILIVSDRDGENYYILKVNDIQIFSRWIKKTWINTKTTKICK